MSTMAASYYLNLMKEGWPFQRSLQKDQFNNPRDDSWITLYSSQTVWHRPRMNWRNAGCVKGLQDVKGSEALDATPQ